MREILFKAKRLDNGEWVDGFLVKRPSAVCIGDYSPWYISVPPKDPEDSGGLHNIDPETLCQYTGLTDKNGKKIWENDVVNKTDTNALGWHRDRSCKVRWDEGYCAWGLLTSYGDGYLLGQYDSEQLEVLGSVFDHPELLRGEE